METIKPPTSFGGLRAWAKNVTRRLNATNNLHIVRSGSTDTITKSENGTIINVQNIPTASTSVGGGGGSSNPGLLIYRSDGTQEFFAIEDVLTGYDPDTHTQWSLKFEVAASALVAFSTTAPVGVSSTDRWTLDVSDDQDSYSIPVIRTIGTGESAVTYEFDIAGIYRENIFCAGSDGAIVELIKIG